MEVKNQLRLVPQLILTPQLKLLLKILPMNTLELKDYLLEEVQNNPFLEIEFNDPLFEPINYSREFKEAVQLREEADWNITSERAFYEFEEDPTQEDLNLIERRVKAEETLSEYLRWQINLKDFSYFDKEIADYIIGNLDEKGYLRLSPEEIARDLGIDVERVERVRSIIKKLDPIGVASLDVKECILAQLEVLGYSKESLPYKIVFSHLEEIPEGPKELSKKLGVSEEEMRTTLSIIKGLEPYPAREFRPVNQYVILPDLRFYQEEGEWKVEIIKENDFVLKFNNYYVSLLKRRLKGLPKGTQEYLKEKMRIAETLLKALDYRHTTLYKIGRAILDHQRNFLEKGPKYLKPLTLRILSEETDLHESTVSRVVSQKYVDTPLGIFPLKYFLSVGYRRAGGEGVSAKAIMNYLKELIENEDKKRPMSDAELAKELQKKLGIKIARRTITKYREALNIPSIRERKNKPT